MQTIYLDFDNTLVETNKKVIEILNCMYRLDKSEDDLNDYNYNSIHPITNEQKALIFESSSFFTHLEFKPNVLEVIEKHYNNFNWVILTRGTDINMDKKRKWLKDNLPFEMEVIGVSGDENKICDGIQIDDITAEFSSEATLKILYKSFNNFAWQEVTPNDEVLITNSWLEIDEILSFYSEYDVKTLERR